MFPRLLAACCLASLTLGASACPPTAPNVKVTLVVILASEEGDRVDPKLRSIAAEVRKLNPGLKSFELKTMTCRSLKPGVKAEFELPDGEKARVIVKHAADAQNRVGLAIKPPCQGEIVYRTVCGKFLPIVTRCKTSAGKRLILAVRVQPCSGD